MPNSDRNYEGSDSDLSTSRRRLLQLTGAAGAIGLAGCTGGGDGGDGGSDGGDGGDGGGSQQAVKFWSWMAAEETSGGTSVLQSAEESFESDHSSIDIDTTPVPYGKTKDQLITSATGGSAPDLVTIDVTWLEELVAIGALEPLDDYVSSELEDQLVDGALSSGMVDGSLYAFTWNPNPNFMVYNKNLFEEAGYSDPPQKMADMADIAKAIGELGNDVFGLGVQMDQSAFAADYFHPYLWAFGGNILNDSGEVAVTSQGTIDALSYIKDLTDAGAATKDQNIRNLRTLFGKDKVGIMFEGPWIKGILNGLGMNRDEWGIAVMPSGPATSRPGPVNPSHHQLVIPKQSSVKQAAWDYTEFITTDQDIVVEYFENTGLLPIMKEHYQLDAMEGNLVRTTEQQTSGIKRPNSWGPNRTPVQRTFMGGVQRIVLQGTAPSDAMTNVDETLKTII